MCGRPFPLGVAPGPRARGHQRRVPKDCPARHALQKEPGRPPHPPRPGRASCWQFTSRHAQCLILSHQALEFTLVMPGFDHGFEILCSRRQLLRIRFPIQRERRKFQPTSSVATREDVSVQARATLRHGPVPGSESSPREARSLEPRPGESAPPALQG